MEQKLGTIICQYRQSKKITQDEFASRLGVTPQAVSKWERGSSLPDVSLLSGICTVLDLKADTLLGIESRVVENGDSLAEMDIKKNLIAEPLLVEFGSEIIPCVIEGLKKDYVNKKRKELAQQAGILMPILRLRDNIDLAPTEYQISIYDHVLEKECLDIQESDPFQFLIDQVANCCQMNYHKILNKHLVKLIIDNVKEQYPGVADQLIPDQISYLMVERKLQEMLKKGESIRNFLHIIEELEEEML